MSKIKIEKLWPVIFFAGISPLVITILLKASITVLLVTTFVFCLTCFYINKEFQKQNSKINPVIQFLKNGDFNLHEKLSESDSSQAVLSEMANFYENKILNIIIESYRLSSVYNEMQIITDDFLHKAETMNQVANSVASATEEMSVNTHVISQTTKAVSENMSSAANSIDEMNATVNEISRSAEEARNIARLAVNSMTQATNKVTDLGQKSTEISKVIKVIEDISEQTKLLALNATIEAARAGEAGKGFSVVANEVKELATQTASATSGIKKSLMDIQQSSEAASEEIIKINDIILQVEENIASIATAVEEQNVTTQDISENISGIDSGLKEVNHNILEGAEAAGLVAADMEKVNRGARQILDDSTNINNEIKTLDEIAKRLTENENSFSFSSEKLNKLKRMIEVANLLQGREKDHLIWVKKVQNAIAEHQEKIDVQKDPTLCGMGKFLNSPERKELEKNNPGLGQVFKTMDEPHKQLHLSAVKLEKMLGDENLSGIDLNNYYNTVTVKLLRELVSLFHQAMHENFNSLSSSLK